MTANPSTAHALADLIGGQVVTTLDGKGPLIFVAVGQGSDERVNVLECRSTGSVRLNGVEIGTFSQGPDALAEAYWAAVDGMAA